MADVVFTLVTVSTVRMEHIIQMVVAIITVPTGTRTVGGLSWPPSLLLAFSYSSSLRRSFRLGGATNSFADWKHRCITARRRRRAGNVPFRGTGWAAGRTPAGHAPAQYTGAQPYYGNNQQPPPVYGAPQNQTYYGNDNPSNQGYFGGQQSGVELQQPQGAYRPPGGGDPVYNPPAGAPPGKGGDGIIR